MVLGLPLFVGLFNNLALLIILVAVYGYLDGRLRGARPLRRQLWHGLIFSLAAFGCMQVKIPVHEGVLVDQRNAIVILAGTFGGPVSVLIAAAAASAYRAYLGGIGVYGGLLGICLSMMAGIFLHFRKERIDSLWKAALAAAGSALFILPGFLPIGDLRTGFELMSRMALPYGTAITIGLLAGGLLLASEERRNEAQASLRRSEAKYRELFESLIDLSWRTDEEGRIAIVSPSSLPLLGYAPEELVGRRIPDLLRDPSRAAAFGAQMESMGSVLDFEAEVTRKDGTVIVVSTNARRIGGDEGPGGAQGATRDVTRLKRAEEGLRAMLADRETLLKELYHRANNNMQLIASLLQLRIDAAGGRGAEELMAETRSRIHAMSLVYEKLSRSESLSRVRMAGFLADLVEYVAESRPGSAGRIAASVEVEDTETPLDSAIPLALVVDELVSNAYDHAFPGGRRGSVSLRLRRAAGGEIALSVSDDGVGLPPGVDPGSGAGFGTSLALDLARKQLRGRVEVSTGPGVSYRITYRDDLYEERVPTAGPAAPAAGDQPGGEAPGAST